MGIVIEVREVETITLPAFEDQQMINEAISILSVQPHTDNEKPAESQPINTAETTTAPMSPNDRNTDGLAPSVEGVEDESS